MLCRNRTDQIIKTTHKSNPDIIFCCEDWVEMKCACACVHVCARPPLKPLSAKSFCKERCDLRLKEPVLCRLDRTPDRNTLSQPYSSHYSYSSSMCHSFPHKLLFTKRLYILPTFSLCFVQPLVIVPSVWPL